MDKFLLYLNELGILVFIKEVAAMSFIALGYVYLFGRMLMFFDDPNGTRIKNLVAAIMINILAIMYLIEFRQDITTHLHFLYSFFLHTGFAYVIYVTVCFRWFDRTDSFLDSKGLKDHGFKKK